MERDWILIEELVGVRFVLESDEYLWIGPLAAMVIAQILKPLLIMLRLRRLDWQRMRRSGGMPSSHTALVVALVTELWMHEGVSNPVLAISVFVAAIVMYDAAGVRWQTGRHAAVLNRLLRDLNGRTGTTHGNESNGHEGDRDHVETTLQGGAKAIRPLSVVKAPWWLVDWPVLDEYVGHKPIEVVGGCVVGVVVAVLLR